MVVFSNDVSSIFSHSKMRRHDTMPRRLTNLKASAVIAGNMIQQKSTNHSFTRPLPWDSHLCQSLPHSVEKIQKTKVNL
jgi:hypothetical protein